MADSAAKSSYKNWNWYRDAEQENKHGHGNATPSTDKGLKTADRI